MSFESNSDVEKTGRDIALNGRSVCVQALMGGGLLQNVRHSLLRTDRIRARIIRAIFIPQLSTPMSTERRCFRFVELWRRWTRMVTTTMVPKSLDPLSIAEER